MKRILFGLLLAVASSVLLPTSANAVESCKVFNLRETFNFGYNAEFPTWNIPGSQRVITWATMDSGELNGKKIQRSFGTPAQDWLREAFQSWDDALDSIIFKEGPLSEDIDIKIGWTQVLELDYESLFSVKAPNGLRSNATIEFKHQSVFLMFKENFIQAAQSDIGHVLGMGYITPSSEIISVMEWPFQAPYGQVPLGEFDVSLIRAIYSESTCPSTFHPEIQANMKAMQEAELKAKQEAELKAKQEAELKAKQEAELKAKQEAEAYAAAEVKAKIEADAKAAAEKLVADARAEASKILGAAKAAATKKITITCTKGKLTKKVTAVKPKCPSGYKKK